MKTFDCLSPVYRLFVSELNTLRLRTASLHSDNNKGIPNSHSPDRPAFLHSRKINGSSCARVRPCCGGVYTQTSDYRAHDRYDHHG